MNSLNIITNTQDVLELLSEEKTAGVEINEALSATLKNPAVTWAKFVLTDDMPNKNGMRVPQEEFNNLIKSGIYMPIKMAENRIEDGHDYSEPFGVITNLKQVGNQIIGLAALWLEERGEDIKALKEKISLGSQIDLSWEILYKYFDVEADGTKVLRDTVLKATTVVGNPAYGGRTPILAIASNESDSLPDTCFLVVDTHDGEKVRYFPLLNEDGFLIEVESAVDTINASDYPQDVKDIAISRVEILSGNREVNTENSEDNTLDELETLKQELLAFKQEKETLVAALAEKEAELTGILTELSELREYKSAIEAEASKAERLSNIKQKFTEAGVVKGDDYFETNKDSLLSLEEGALNFMLQEMVAFASTNEQRDASASALPNFNANQSGKITPAELAKALKERKAGK